MVFKWHSPEILENYGLSKHDNFPRRATGQLPGINSLDVASRTRSGRVDHAIRLKVMSFVSMAITGYATSQTQYYGKFLGKLNTGKVEVRGEVYAANSSTIYIRNFNYNGQGSGESVIWGIQVNGEFNYSRFPADDPHWQRDTPAHGLTDWPEITNPGRNKVCMYVPGLPEMNPHTGRFRGYPKLSGLCLAATPQTGGAHSIMLAFSLLGQVRLRYLKQLRRKYQRLKYIFKHQYS